MSEDDLTEGLLRALGPEIVIGRTEPCLLAPQSAPRPMQGGRAGILVLLTDGTAREATYRAEARREAALAWLLGASRRSPSEVAAVCDWSALELARELVRRQALQSKAAGLLGGQP